MRVHLSRFRPSELNNGLDTASGMPIAVRFNADEHPVPGAGEDVVKREKPKPLAERAVIRAPIRRALKKLMQGLDLSARQASSIMVYTLEKGWINL